MDTLARSFGSFSSIILDDLDDCSSDTDTYVERRSRRARARNTTTTAEKKRTTAARPADRQVSSEKALPEKDEKAGGAGENGMREVVKEMSEKVTRRETETVGTERRTEKGTDWTDGEEDGQGHGQADRETDRERNEEDREGDREGRSKDRSRAEGNRQGAGGAKGTRLQEGTVRGPAPGQSRAPPAPRAHGEGPGRVQTSRRTLPREAPGRERERQRAEQRCKELETIVANMRESYERELDDLREQLSTSATAPAPEPIVVQLPEPEITVRGTTVREPSVRETKIRKTTVEEERSPAAQTEAFDPIVSQLPRPRVLTPFPPLPPTTEDSRSGSTLLAQLEERDAELQALRLFHDEAPQLTVPELAESVRALNAEIAGIAAAVAGGVPLGRTWEVAQAWALEAAEPALERCLGLLAGPQGMKGVDYAQDPTLVRLALQAWLVTCCERVFARFLFGLDDAEDELLGRLYERVQTQESMPVAARWRALTRRHARSALASPGFGAALTQATRSLEMEVLIGFEALLRFAGAHTPPGVLLSDLSGTHGRRIEKAVRSATRLAEALAEKAPPGCDVFTVDVRKAYGRSKEKVEEDEQANGGGDPDGRAGRFIWVGRKRRKGTRASKSLRTQSVTDTNIRQWDKDDSDEEEDEEDEDEYDDDAHDILRDGPNHAGAAVVCSLGFGLRRVLRRRRRPARAGREAAAADEDALQRERRRGNAEEATPRAGASASSYSSTSLTTSTSATTARTERAAPAPPAARLAGGRDSDTARERARADGDVAIVVKTDVLMSSTVDVLQRRFGA
ncbi:hypothetical protein DFH11DRAFT_1741056 [Phellopilus nigrolimitatus]|nr:hypothetical protein DFH11DRAFT_1741056 [Phellopilus nigrolimitatus]